MKGFDKTKLKKQIVSGGIYIALAAAVVTVTLNGVNNIIGGGTDYEISEEDSYLNDNTDNGTDLIYDIHSEDTGSEKSFLDEKLFDDNLYLSLNDNIGFQNDETSKTDIDFNEQTSSESAVSGSAEGVTDECTDISEPSVVETDLSDESEGNNMTEVSAEPEEIEYPTEPDPTSYGFYAKPADGYIDKEFTNDKLIYSVTMRDYRTHNGVDITGDPGSSVKAINAGEVIDIYFDDFYGNTVKIDHGNGIIAYYMNLSETLPAGIGTGSKVKMGQTIGGIGNSASIESAEVSHLHLSITRNGEYIDPGELLRNNQ